MPSSNTNIDELEHLHATVQAISVRDPLTDLHNRRYLAEDDESTLDELLGRADVQLYASKHAGRNQTSYGQDASNEATPL